MWPSSISAARVRAAAIATSSNTAARDAGMAELELRALHLAFGGLKVLEGVSFTVDAGELLALIGPNGAGKTSVLNCICGIYRPSAGDVFFAGERITGERPHAIARLRGARSRAAARARAGRPPRERVGGGGWPPPPPPGLPKHFADRPAHPVAEQL